MLFSFYHARAHTHNHFYSKWIGLDLDKLVYNLSSNLTTSRCIAIVNECNLLGFKERFRRSFVLAAHNSMCHQMCVCAVNHLLQAKQKWARSNIDFSIHFYIPFADSILTYDFFFLPSFIRSFVRSFALSPEEHFLFTSQLWMSSN